MGGGGGGGVVDSGHIVSKVHHAQLGDPDLPEYKSIKYHPCPQL